MRFDWLLVLGMLGHVTADGQAAKALPVTTLKEVGLDAAKLASFDAEIASGKYGNVDSLLILRHGKVAYDRRYTRDYGRIYGTEAKTNGALNPKDFGGPYNYFNPWWHPFYRNGGELHSLQSVTKSVASAVIGVAVTRHEFPSLDTPVLKFFDESKVANVDERKRRMTIRNLLTMTTGVTWQDDLPYSDPNNSTSLMEASADWVKYFIDQPMAEDPGKRFYYNDGAPQVLAYIFQQATGQDIEEYAAKYLFAPIGIERWYWKRIPTGLADTEGGLYLERHDVARLMMLFEHDGLWEGKRVVSSEWVKATITPAVTVDEKSGVKYGLLWWLYPYGKDDSRYVFGGSGFGGQASLVIPAYDIVIVVNGWNLLKGPGLGSRVVIDRVLAAVTDGKH
jgi:CubicO group peptidase (beta-lactamase class C family)